MDALCFHIMSIPELQLYYSIAIVSCFVLFGHLPPTRPSRKARLPSGARKGEAATQAAPGGYRALGGGITAVVSQVTQYFATMRSDQKSP